MGWPSGRHGSGFAVPLVLLPRGGGVRPPLRGWAHQPPLLSRRMRSLGVTMSVRRMPNLSLTTTTSPCAIRYPLTSTSIGSPASVSSSTTEPCASCRMCLIGMRVRPSSTVSCTGISRIMLMSLPAEPVAPPAAKLANGAGDSAGAVSAPPSAGLASAIAAAHSAAILSWLSSGAAALSADMTLSQPTALRFGQQLIDLDRVAAAGSAVVRVEHRHAVDLGLDDRRHVELDEVARLQREQLLDRGVGLGQLGHQRHLGRLD